MQAKNYWGPGDDYQGINTSWFHPDLNIAFEVRMRMRASALVTTLLRACGANACTSVGDDGC